MNATQLNLFETQYIPRTFREAQRLIDSIDDINSGGCGVAALALYRWRKNHGLRTDGFVFLYREYDDWELNHNESCIETGDLDSLEIPAHVALRVGRRLYDSRSSNANNTCGTELIQRGISESILLHAVNNIDGWNLWFDREESIPEIERLLGVDLSDIVYHPGE